MRSVSKQKAGECALLEITSFSISTFNAAIQRPLSIFLLTRSGKTSPHCGSLAECRVPGGNRKSDSMELKNVQRIGAPRSDVWSHLNDIDILKKCIPGCQSLERVSDEELAAQVQLKIGPVKATFKGKVKFENLIEPVSMTLTGEGSGGIAGHARGGADVVLEESSEGTVLTYDAHAQVGGKIAQLGTRLVESTARKLAAEFFTRFENEVAALSEGEESVETLAG